MGTLTVGSLEIPDSSIIIDLPRTAPAVLTGRVVAIPLEDGVQPDMVWDVTVWDNQLWEGDTVAVDVVCDTVEFSWRRGGGVGNHYDAGTATLVLHNPDGRYTPDYTLHQDGTGTRVGASQLTATLNGQRVFTGRITAFEEPFAPGETPQVVANATDHWADLNVNLPELPAPVGHTDGVLERLDRILDRANWPPEQIDLPPPLSESGVIGPYDSSVLQPTTLAQDLMTEAKHVADHRTYWDSAPYRIYLDADAVFRITTAGDSSWEWGEPVPEPSPPPTHDSPTWNDPTPEWPVLHFEDCPRAVQSGGESFIYWQTAPVTVGVDTDTIDNDITVARTGGTAQRIVDEDSVARFGRRTWQRMDYLYTTNSETAQRAQAMIRTSAWPYQHVSQLVIDLEANSQAPLPAWAYVIEWFHLFDMYRHVTLEHELDGGELVTARGRIVNVDGALNRNRGTLSLTLESTPDLWWST